MEKGVDYQESEKMDEFVSKTVTIAEEYANARYEWALAKLKMDSLLAEAYSNNAIKESLAVEKAYVQLTINNPEAKKDYESMIKEESNYKGLEQVLKAREGKKSWKQSQMSYQKIVNNNT